MREAICQKLIDSVPEVQGKVYEPQAARAGTKPPYLVVRQGVEIEDTPWTGFRRIIEVWPYVARTTFQKVDDLAVKVVAALDKQILTDAATGEVFTCQYLGTVGQDFVDEDWDAITRGLRFAVLALQPVAVPETVANDPWLEALADWTETILGTAWTVYRNAWPLGYRRPAVMWRLAGVEVQEKARAMFEVRKRFIGHVLGSTPNEQITGALTVIQELGNAIKLPLDTANKRYLTVNNPAVDYRADALTAGQVSVILSRLTNRPAAEVPLLMETYGRGTLNGGD
ncbi:MAG TPA: hypothetical protein PK728_11765 [Bacillota bacterium]|nr:hypothetical protein [Bacillota bacterium]